MVGLTVYNNSGYVQINEDYQNFELKQIANDNTTQQSADFYTDVSSGYKQVALNALSTPVLAFGCGFQAVMPSMLNSPSWTNNLYNYRVDVVGGIGSYVPTWVFDMSFEYGGSGMLMVYTANGQVAYNSDKKYLRILEAGTLASNSNSVFQRDYRGKVVAFVMSRPGLRQHYTSVNGANYLNNARTKFYQDPESGMVTVNWHTRQVGGQAATIPLIQRDTKFFLVDVSNFRSV
jgi:hypothetical protein